MMSCRAVRDSLPEYAAGRPIPSGVQIAAHLSCCTACAAAERELRAAFAALATQPAPPASADGEARARRALGAAAAADRPATLKLGRGGSKLHPLAARLAVTAVLAAALIALLPRQGSRSVGAAVEAAVQRANTWHLVGWKLQGGQRVPWEIWGRRSPFFYREQLGEELNFDDG